MSHKRFCQYAVPENPGGICGSLLSGRGRSKFCSIHSRIAREELRKRKNSHYVSIHRYLHGQAHHITDLIIYSIKNLDQHFQFLGKDSTDPTALRNRFVSKTRGTLGKLLAILENPQLEKTKGFIAHGQLSDRRHVYIVFESDHPKKHFCNHLHFALFERLLHMACGQKITSDISTRIFAVAVSSSELPSLDCCPSLPKDSPILRVIDRLYIDYLRRASNSFDYDFLALLLSHPPEDMCHTAVFYRYQPGNLRWLLPYPAPPGDEGIWFPDGWYWAMVSMYFHNGVYSMLGEDLFLVYKELLAACQERCDE